MKSRFVSQINQEFLKRELDKDQSVKHLNIKLEKFCGYDSPVDFYTFRTRFEKIYLISTPSHHLPDLLKNNFLGEPALSIVKSLDDINEIWSRLRKAFGDTKTMLIKKIQTLTNTRF